MLNRKEYNHNYYKEYYTKNKDKYILYSQTYRKNNTEKIAEWRKKYREENKCKINRYMRVYKLKTRYNLTENECLDLLKKQDYKCAICLKTEKESKQAFHIDHNHLTGKVRGIVCFECNTKVLRTLEAYPHLIDRAKEYLNATRG